MSAHFEETLIRHCAATLAGHKCGSLFSYHPGAQENVADTIASLNALLNQKGVRARLIGCCPRGGVLVYVYRPAALRETLSSTEASAFLTDCGYPSGGTDAALDTLTVRLQDGRDAFPHEIGVFLGYPVQDVIAFIRHNGFGGCLCGCWKAYGNPSQAQRTFALYQKCRDVYLRCYRRGFDVTRLTIAA